MRRVSAEGGEFPFDFGQLYQGLFPDQLGVGGVAQGLLVTAGRQRAIRIPKGTPDKPRLISILKFLG